MLESTDDAYCFSILWSIDKLSLNPFRTKEMLSSPSFKVEALGGSEWRMILFPRGTVCKEYMSLYLQRNSGCPGLSNIVVDFKLTLDTKFSSFCAPRVVKGICYREEDFWGYLHFVKTDLVRFITSTSLMRTFSIRCEISPSANFAVDIAKDLRLDLKTLSENFNCLFDTKQLFDVVLRSGDVEFKAHKAVLATRASKFFHCLQLDEIIEGVVVRDVSFISSPVLKTFLSFLYSDKLDLPVSEIPRELLGVAEQFELPHLVKKMQSFPNVCYARTLLNVEHKSVMWELKKTTGVESLTRSCVRIVPTSSVYAGNLVICCQVISDSSRGPVNRIDSSIRLSSMTKDRPVFIRCKILLSEDDESFWELLDDEHLFECDEEWHFSINLRTDYYDISIPEVSCLTFELDLCDGVKHSTIQEDWTASIEDPTAYYDFGQLSHDLEWLRRSEIFSDVLIMCSGQIFMAHKFVLAARSPVFEKMFEHNVIENQFGVVRIRDIRPKVMKLLLSYMYGGKVDSLKYEDASGLYEAADKYAIIVLKEKCAAFLLAELTDENAHRLLYLADMHFDTELKTKVSDFVKRKLAMVLDQDMKDFEFTI